MTFPAAVPEIPVSHIDRAVEYYVERLGFTHDWGGEEGGIAGVSRGGCRLFLTNSAFREVHGNVGPVLLWMNLDSSAEVDELYERWAELKVTLISTPEDKPWNLHEFVAADADGNRFRVFYDFGREAAGRS